MTLGSAWGLHGLSGDPLGRVPKDYDDCLARSLWRCVCVCVCVCMCQQVALRIVVAIYVVASRAGGGGGGGVLGVVSRNGLRIESVELIGLPKFES
jgi:hypothetical protein